MQNYEEKIHQLFESAFSARCNPESTAGELYAADEGLASAMAICDEMERWVVEENAAYEVVNDRLRCCIERMAIYTRLLRMAYGTADFDGLSAKQESLCLRYVSLYSGTQGNDEVRKSSYQLTVMAYQSLSANYFRRGGMGRDKALCTQAVEYINKAIELTEGDEYYDVLQKNRQQLLTAMSGC